MMVVGSARSLPWNPRTRAAAIAAPRNGSSPAPSTTRPQRASRAISTIGAKVQWTPWADASTAATRAAPSTATVSKLAASARETGKMVRQPWITS